MEVKSDDLLKSNVINCNGDDENFALHKLDDRCLLKIIQYLRIDDARNLAKTSKRLKNVFLFKYHKFTFEFHSNMLSKTTERGSKVLDVILSEYGPHIRSWTLIILNMYKSDAIEIVRKVSQYSTNLKRIEFKGVTDMDFVNCPVMVKCLPNVETLSFVYCQLIDRADFLQHFRKLKQLHFEECGTTSNNLQMLFKNNHEIGTYYCNVDDTFPGDTWCDGTFSNDFGLCEFGPKFDSLCLARPRHTMTPPQMDEALRITSTDMTKMFVKRPRLTMAPLQMDKMLRLATTNLTKLKLDVPFAENLDLFLAELAKQQTLIELELTQVQLSHSECKTVVQSFPNLQILVLCPTFPDSMLSIDGSWTTWPKDLKKLKTNIRFDSRAVSSIIYKLKWLSHLYLDAVSLPPQLITQILQQSLTKRNYSSLNLVVANGLIMVDYRCKTIYPLRHRQMMSDSDKEAIQIDFPIATYAERKLTKSFAY